MYTYKTSEIARIIGIHPNTVRLYEELKLIPKPERQRNGYRVFTSFHIEQFKLARIALQVEVLQNGLRKKAIEIIKLSAAGDFDKAITLTDNYLEQIRTEQQNAEEAIGIVNELLLSRNNKADEILMSRKETADYLHISMDTLRNWEMNGLVTIKRKQNGYRVYSEDEINQLKIIRSLRCANYSLAAILRLLNNLSDNPNADIRAIIDTPPDNEDIISVCDKLLTSLAKAQSNASAMREQLVYMKKSIKINPPL
ncbi:MerR family transcriptional regulator [Anaerocolumna sp. MB42-C2]|uniref:MerR family transcriptional regulator n=1 Tax=Anaerocolumna sp. MB42-C2 TaxID=3070997 RepID=UPI0027E1B45B|nr:MerR family transcriptional regulator [Anaerocolumna sp. MB42-C2]WMJ85339.1 MerR family transcriptional regulator [Anaerocolumna sp. MB42-C2]